MPDKYDQHKAIYDPAALPVVDIPSRPRTNHEESFARLQRLPLGKALLFPAGTFSSQSHAMNAFRPHAAKAKVRVHTRIDNKGIYVWLTNA
jgi:hypothetical protein